MNTFEDAKINVKLKIAALWTSFMFLYIYVDYFHLYMPGTLEDIMAGKVFTFEISQAFTLAGLMSVSIPAIMISISVILSARLNRKINLIVAALFIPYSLFNLVGEAWIHMFFAATVEVALLVLIIRFAWKWPKEISQN